MHNVKKAILIEYFLQFDSFCADGMEQPCLFQGKGDSLVIDKMIGRQKNVSFTVRHRPKPLLLNQIFSAPVIGEPVKDLAHFKIRGIARRDIDDDIHFFLFPKISKKLRGDTALHLSAPL